MQICAQRYKMAQEGRMFPSQSGGKPHKATAYRDNEFPFCSCQAFIFGRSKIAKAEGVHQTEVTFTCKHLAAVFNEVCDWKQEAEHQYRFDRTCPKCGGDIVDADVDTLVPDDPDGAVDDLRALLAEMNGEAPPPPLPKPTPWTVEVEVTTVERRVVAVMALDEDAAWHAASEQWEIGHVAVTVPPKVEVLSSKPGAPTPAPTPAPAPAPRPAVKKAATAKKAAPNATAAVSNLVTKARTRRT